MIDRALTEAGLDPAWRTEAAEPGMEDRILAEHQDGIERLKALARRRFNQWSARFLWAGYHPRCQRGRRRGVMGPYRLAGGPR